MSQAGFVLMISGTAMVLLAWIVERPIANSKSPHDRSLHAEMSRARVEGLGVVGLAALAIGGALLMSAAAGLSVPAGAAVAVVAGGGALVGAGRVGQRFPGLRLPTSWRPEEPVIELDALRTRTGPIFWASAVLTLVLTLVLLLSLLVWLVT